MPRVTDFDKTTQSLATELYGAMVKMVPQPHHQVQGIQADSHLYIPVEYKGKLFQVRIVEIYE